MVAITEILVSLDWVYAFLYKKKKKIPSSINLRVITNASFLGIRKITHNKLWWSSLRKKNRCLESEVQCQLENLLYQELIALPAHFLASSLLPLQPREFLALLWLLNEPVYLSFIASFPSPFLRPTAISALAPSHSFPLLQLNNFLRFLLGYSSRR